MTKAQKQNKYLLLSEQKTIKSTWPCVSQSHIDSAASVSRVQANFTLTTETFPGAAAL